MMKKKMKMKMKMKMKRKIWLFALIIILSTVGAKKVSSINNNILTGQTSQITSSTTNENIEKTDVKIEKVNPMDPNLILVNKENMLKEYDYPEKLTIPNIKFISNGDPKVRQMKYEAAKALESLFSAAENGDIVLLGVSGYRDYDYQENLYNNKVSRSGKEEAYRVVAKPGSSEHQTGLAMDVLSEEYKSLDEGFENTTTYKWLKKNCYKYGFIIRYQKGKEQITGYSFEPWHLRYVGIEAAKGITEKGITLEEYLNKSNVSK